MKALQFQILTFTILVIVTTGCSGKDEPPTSTLEFDLTMGPRTDHVSDTAPVMQWLGDTFIVRSHQATEGGNNFVLQMSMHAVEMEGTVDVGLGKPVQAGFTVPGMTGTVLYESGTFTATRVEWSGAARIEGTFSNLHRPVDALGLASESAAAGSIGAEIPAR